MSVGYGTHKKGRPLSPTEVAALFQRAIAGGSTEGTCAEVVGFKDRTQVSRFLSVLRLAPDLLHLISWGRSSDSIAFTTAVELARIPNTDDQRAIAASILEQGLQTDEVRQVAQLMRRSNRPVDDCLREVLGMRPTVHRVYVFMGAIVDGIVRAALSERTQEQRNALLRSALDALGLEASGRLGDQFFTLVGGERLNSQLREEGREAIEDRVRIHLKKSIGEATRER